MDRGRTMMESSMARDRHWIPEIISAGTRRSLEFWYNLELRHVRSLHV